MRQIALLFALSLSWGWLPAQVRVEYVAHACYVLESPAGVRVVLDPYNSYRWLGYTFPRDLEVDAVLISHPHYDHNAGYYFPHRPIFRLAGEYSIGDIRIRGVAGRHADPYGKEFGQTNVVWRLETGGLSLAHLGDTGPLSPGQIEALQGVDILMIPVDGKEHILSFAQVERILQQLHPRLILPMHYRLKALSRLPRSLGPIDPWLKGRHVRRVPSNQIRLRPGSLPSSPQILLLRPHPGVRPWSESLSRALRAPARARRLLGEKPEKAIALLREAVASQPQVIGLWCSLGRALSREKQQRQAIEVLERGLARAAGDDEAYTDQARVLLARLYRRAQEMELARAQYRLLLGSFNLKLKQESRTFLARQNQFDTGQEQRR